MDGQKASNNGSSAQCVTSVCILQPVREREKVRARSQEKHSCTCCDSVKGFIVLCFFFFNFKYNHRKRSPQTCGGAVKSQFVWYLVKGCHFIHAIPLLAHSVIVRVAE